MPRPGSRRPYGRHRQPVRTGATHSVNSTGAAVAITAVIGCAECRVRAA
ncbi:hypothetical protein STRIP9103_05306 [Streptomyces ipomoeae 91-03]|uniref:Uncharacterized protein n=1 Tax=Streptomyces ipomoeae 91-03 TaxID=698759 RepID=L1L1N2_9ACTN|nr:hypothetical protein STRIP9103_05306 [Streptomyces ipomoeae 91-03]